MSFISNPASFKILSILFKMISNFSSMLSPIIFQSLSACTCPKIKTNQFDSITEDNGAFVSSDDWYTLFIIS